jgi:hypothetical protein
MLSTYADSAIDVAGVTKRNVNQPGALTDARIERYEHAMQYPYILFVLILATLSTPRILSRRAACVYAIGHVRDNVRTC